MQQVFRGAGGTALSHMLVTASAQCNKNASALKSGYDMYCACCILAMM